jgi:hypothetical protein
MTYVIVIPEHIDLMPSKDGQAMEACKGNKYVQIESDWTALTATLPYLQDA